METDLQKVLAHCSVLVGSKSKTDITQYALQSGLLEKSRELHGEFQLTKRGKTFDHDFVR